MVEPSSNADSPDSPSKGRPKDPDDTPAPDSPLFTSTPTADENGANGRSTSAQTTYHVQNTYFEIQYGGIRGQSINAKSMAGRDIEDHRISKSADQKPVTSFSVTEIEPSRLAFLRAVVVESGPSEDAVAILQREGVLILRGPVGIGKGSAAISLFEYQEGILEISPSATIDELLRIGRTHTFGTSKNFLIDSISPTTLRDLTGYSLRAISRQLRAQECRLIVTVDDRLPMSSDVISQAVQWDARPASLEVMRRHIRQLISTNDAQSLEEAYTPGTLERVLQGRTLAYSESVARVLVNCYKLGHTAEEVFQTIGTESVERLKNWFAQTRSPAEVALLLSASILSGAAYLTVAENARKIEGMIAKASRIDLVDQPLNFMEPRATKLENVMAAISQDFANTEFGSAPTSIVVMDHPTLPSAVLHTVWTEYDTVASAMWEWLQQAGSDRDYAVRVRVAGAVARIAEIDFAAVRRRLLLPWATSGDVTQARTAGDAIGLAAFSAEVSEMVLGLLHHWLTQEHSDQLRWVAALAFGHAGVRFTSTAMSEYFDLADKSDDRFFQVIVGSIEQVFNYGTKYDRTVALAVVTRIADWIQVPRSRPARVAMQVIVDLALDVGRTKDLSVDSTWSLLASDEGRRSSGTLLRASMSSKQHQAASFAAVRQIVAMADLEPALVEQIRDLLTEVVFGIGAERSDRERILYFLRLWGSGFDAINAASSLALALAERER